MFKVLTRALRRLTSWGPLGWVLCGGLFLGGVAQAAVPQVSAGAYYSAVVRSDGSLWTWGINPYGQLGNGTTTATLQANQVGEGFVAVSAGTEHVLALKSDGSLWAWGHNDAGQVGDGSTVDVLVPKQVGQGFTAVAAGGKHSLALRSDGSLWAWGLNNLGQLGDGSLTNAAAPRWVGGGYRAIAAGHAHSVALRSDGSLWAWGNNAVGELGIYEPPCAVGADGYCHGWVERIPFQPTPARVNVSVGEGEGFSAIAAGQGHTLVLQENGTLWAWGFNSAGQVGDGSGTGPVRTPTIVGRGFRAVAAGGVQSFAFNQDGSVWAWGRFAARVPQRMGNPYTAIAAGYDHAVALRPDGSLWAWGDNYYGQLGDGTSGGHRLRRQVGTDVSLMSAGTMHGAAIHSDGSLWTWGSNGDGRLGLGGTADVWPPQKVGEGYSAVSAGGRHTLAIQRDGSLWAWGANNNGQLGDGTRTEARVPRRIGEGFAAVSAGNAHSLALKTDGSLWGWGANSRGQVGNGRTEDATTPVPLGHNFAAISAGVDNASMALGRDGTVWSWGAAIPCAVDGSGARRPDDLLPRAVGSGFSAIATGGFGRLALKPDGSLWAWAQEYDPQRSNPYYANPLSCTETPAFVGQGFVAIAAGRHFNEALTSDGSLWAWGSNYVGQFGDGSSWEYRYHVDETSGQSSREGAQPRLIDRGFVAISTTEVYSLALKADGSLWESGVVDPVPDPAAPQRPIYPTPVLESASQAPMNLLQASASASTFALECLFNWAERSYPGDLNPAGVASAAVNGLYGRRYAAVNAYVGVRRSDDRLFYAGPLTSQAMTDLGAVAPWLAMAGCR